MEQSEIIYNITNPMSDTDPRVLTAFAAIATPAGDQDFPNEVMNALQKYDWQTLLKIAFSKPLNYQQSQEFMDTMIYTQTQVDVILFLNKNIKSIKLMIHPDFRNQFENEFAKVSRTISKSAHER